MSFLLGGKKKRQGAMRNYTGSNGPAFRPGGGLRKLSGSRQTSVMLQRHPSVAANKNKETMHHAAVQPARVTPHHPQQSAVTMEEIMEDLETLKNQQEESLQKLGKAREEKKEQENLRVDLACRLCDLQYQDGQTREEYDLVKEIHKNGAEKFELARNGADAAGPELNYYARKLSDVIHTKRALCNYQNKQEHALARLHDKATLLRGALVSSNQLMEEEEAALQTLEESACRLEEAFAKETDRLNIYLNQVKQRQQANDKLQSELSGIQQQQTVHEKKLDEITKAIQGHQESYSSEIDVLEKSKDDKDSALAALRGDYDKIVHEYGQTKKAFTSALERQKKILSDDSIKALSLGGLESKIDMENLQILLEDERQKAEKYAAEKSKMDSESVELQEQLRLLRDGEHQNENAKSTALANQKDRLATISKLAQEESDHKERLAMILKNQIEPLKTDITKRHSESQRKMAIAKERSLVAQKEICKAEQQLESARSRCANAKAAIDSFPGILDKDITHWSEKIGKSSKAIEKLENELKALQEKESSFLESNSDDLEYKEKADQIIEEYPALANVEISYDPGKTAKEQAKHDLVDILRDCKERVLSAKKMRKQLDEAARKNDEEAEMLRHEAEKEAKRKETTRRRRELRNSGDLTKPVKSKKDGSPCGGDSQSILAGDRVKLPSREVDNTEKTIKASGDTPISQVQSTQKEEDNQLLSKELSHHGGDQKNSNMPETACGDNVLTNQELRSEHKKMGTDKVSGSAVKYAVHKKEEDDGPPLSQAKPRNLLTTFSLSSQHVEVLPKSMPSSQKKVHWSADDQASVPGKRRASTKSRRRSDKEKMTSQGRVRSTNGKDSLNVSISKSNLQVSKAHAAIRSKYGKAGSSRRTNDQVSSHRKIRETNTKSDSLVPSANETKGLSVDANGRKRKNAESLSTARHPEKKSVHEKRSKSKHRVPGKEGDESRRHRRMTSKAKRSQEMAALSRGDHKSKKRRRNHSSGGTPSVLVESQSSGVMSFGRDVAFGF